MRSDYQKQLNKKMTTLTHMIHSTECIQIDQYIRRNKIFPFIISK